MPLPQYDIIGDIHGHAQSLKTLLQKLGYHPSGNVWGHPEGRKVVFLGDFIDRGPAIRETLHLVKTMCDAGTAQAVMGNHEFNALGFHTPVPGKKDAFFRPHSGKNVHQHQETLRQFIGFEGEWQQFIAWFKELPLFLEFDRFRAVHACWDENHVAWARQHYTGITDAFLAETNDKATKSPAFTAVDELLKGKECSLPAGHFFEDKDGHRRTECRLKWWAPLSKRKEQQDVLMGCPESYATAPVSQEYFHYAGAKPVFFGHYWLRGEPVVEHPQAICLDYSVAKDGILVGYRTEYLEGDLGKGFVW